MRASTMRIGQANGARLRLGFLRASGTVLGLALLVLFGLSFDQGTPVLWAGIGRLLGPTGLGLVIFFVFGLRPERDHSLGKGAPPGSSIKGC